jgi:putative redox protein
MNPQEVVVRSTGQGLRQDVEAGAHRMVVDEPLSVGGTDQGPNPYDFILAALGACTAMTLQLYARRKDWPLESVEVRLSHDKIHAKDCATCETKEGKLDRIERSIVLRGPLSEEQRKRLGEIADRCPVHRTFTSEIHIETRVLPEVAPGVI